MFSQLYYGGCSVSRALYSMLLFSLFKQCKSLVHIGGSKSDTFRLGVVKGCQLSPNLFITLKDRILGAARKWKKSDSIAPGFDLFCELCPGDITVLWSPAIAGAVFSRVWSIWDSEPPNLKSWSTVGYVGLPSLGWVRCCLKDCSDRCGGVVGFCWQVRGRMECMIDRWTGAAKDYHEKIWYELHCERSPRDLGLLSKLITPQLNSRTRGR